MKLLYWDYVCGQCGQVGSVPLDKRLSVTNAAYHVVEAHGEFNPSCHQKYQGRWVSVLKVDSGDGE